MKRAIWLIVIVLSLVLVILFFQQGNNSSSTNEARQKSVVTTIYPIYYLTKSIAGNDVDVESLIKPGEDMHSFLPTPAQMVELDRSDMLITLGEELEPWVEKLSEATRVDIVSLEDGLDLLYANKTHHDHQGDHKEHEDHHHGAIDPHVWLDFDNDITMVKMIRDALSKHYPEHKRAFSNNASLLIEQLENLKKSYAKSLKHCKKSRIIVGHNAFGYMQRAYGFEALAINGIFAHSKPNAKRITELSNIIKYEKLHYLFSDPINSDKSARQLAKDMNLTLEPIYALGNTSLGDDQKGEDLITLLYFDLEQLKKGLECH